MRSCPTTFLNTLLLELKEKKAPQKGDFIFSYQNTYLSEKIIRTYIQKNDRNLFKKCGIFVGVLRLFFGANDDIFSLTIHRQYIASAVIVFNDLVLNHCYTAKPGSDRRH